MDRVTRPVDRPVGIEVSETRGFLAGVGRKAEFPGRHPVSPAAVGQAKAGLALGAGDDQHVIQVGFRLLKIETGQAAAVGGGLAVLSAKVVVQGQGEACRRLAAGQVGGPDIDGPKYLLDD